MRKSNRLTAITLSLLFAFALLATLPASALAIDSLTVDPIANQSVIYDETVTLTAIAHGGNPPYHYGWIYYIDEQTALQDTTGRLGTPIADGEDYSGARTQSLTITGRMRTEGYYRCMITDSTPQFKFVFSPPTQVFVISKADAAIITKQPVGGVIGMGQSYVLSVETAPLGFGSLTYQWQKNTSPSNTGGTAIAGANSPSLTVIGDAAGIAYYYCVITSSATGYADSTSTSIAAAVEVRKDAPVIKTLPSIYLVAGSSAKLPAAVQPYGALEKGYTWSTSNSSVVKVNNIRTGSITAAKGAAGKTAKLVAKASEGGKTSVCTVYVVKKAVALKSFSIAQSGTIALVGGKTLQIKPKLNPLKATGIVPRYTSSNKKVAVVDSTGIVTAISPGKTKISVIAGKYTKSFILQVGNYPPLSLSLNKSTYSMKKGKTYQLSVKSWKPLNTDLKLLTWKSNYPRIVSVTSSGKITAKAKGKATITAKTWNGKVAKCIVSVK